MRRPKTKKQPTRHPRARRRRDRGPVISRAALWRIGVVLGWAGTFAGAAYGLHRLETRQHDLAARQPTLLRWVSLPPWLEDPRQGELLAEIADQTGLATGDDLFDPGLCSRVGTNLTQSPWVADVARVSKQPDGSVWVDASFRKPLTMVESQGMAYLVDHSGVRLPRQQGAAHLRPEDWIVVRRVGGRKPPVGEPWPGADLAAGLELVSFLERANTAGRLAFRRSILGVDAGEFDPRTGGGLRVITTNPQSYIHWGLPPGEEYGIEPSAESKLDALNRLYAKLGRLPDGRPIDVRDDECIRLLEPP